MSTFCTKTVIYGSPSLIPQIAEHIQKDFEKDGFEVSKTPFAPVAATSPSAKAVSSKP